MEYINCSRCGAHMANDTYMEDGVCALCLLADITEELGLYERNDKWENGLSPVQE
jgi:hypothetical protein